MVKVGDRVERRVSYGQGFTETDPQPGTVVYVHPEGRWYTVEFTYWRDGKLRTFRESYPQKSKPTSPPWEAEQ